MSLKKRLKMIPIIPRHFRNAVNGLFNLFGHRYTNSWFYGTELISEFDEKLWCFEPKRFFHRKLYTLLSAEK